MRHAGLQVCSRAFGDVGRYAGGIDGRVQWSTVGRVLKIVQTGEWSDCMLNLRPVEYILVEGAFKHRCEDRRNGDLTIPYMVHDEEENAGD